MTDKTLWTSINNVPRQYDWLAFDEECDVCVIGGGISAALSAYHFQQNDIDTILVSESPIGFMSTGISGSLLRFGNGLSIVELSKKTSKDNAVMFFNECCNALDQIEQIDKESGSFNFQRRSGLCYTKNPVLSDDLHTEYLMCKHNGFDVEYLEKADAIDKLSFGIESGVATNMLDGEVDGYLMAHKLLENAQSNGARIYENTYIDNINTKSNGITLVTNYGKTIRCKKIVMAIGYKQDEYLNVLDNIKTTFCISTKPVESFIGNLDRDIITRYKTDVYSRTTNDNRIIIGGLDASLIAHNSRWGKILNPKKIIETKYQELETRLNLMYCAIMNLEVSHKYNGVYGETADKLPVVGMCEGYPNIYFNLQSGSNPILTAQLSAKLLVDIYNNKPNHLQKLFSCDRESL